MTTDVSVDPTKFDPNWWRKTSWWPMAFAPAAVVVAIVCSHIWPEWFKTLQNSLETPAPYLIAAVAVIYLARSFVTFNPLYMILAALAAALTSREFHFAGTHRGIYIALGVIGAWTVLWRSRIWEPLADFRHTSWLVAAIVAYVLSQVIARRAFKFIPGEQVIHRSLEECAETAAHLVFIVTCLVGSWRKYGRKASPQQADSASEG